MLEQIAYQLPRTKSAQPVYRVGALEYLSSSALYTIDGSEKMGDWGKKIPTNLINVHISQTNSNARDGPGDHVTTEIPGENAKVHDYFDENGNYIGTGFGGFSGGGFGAPSGGSGSGGY